MKLLNQIEKYTILATIFIYPLIILTNFSNFFEAPKLFVLILMALIIILTKTIRIFISKNIEYKTSKIDLAAVLLAAAYLISTIFSMVNKVDALFLPGTTSFVIFAVLLFLQVNQFKESEKENVANTILMSAFVFAVIQIASAFGITKLIPNLPEVFKINIFTTFGNVLTAIVFLISLLPLLLVQLFTKRDLAEKMLAGLVAIVFCISIFSSLYLIFSSKETSLNILNIKYGWPIAVDSLKVNPLIGVGPTNFSHAFNKFKSISYNNELNWNLKYIQNSSYFLTMITEAGVIGLVAFVFLIYRFLKEFCYKNPKHISSFLLILGFLFLPLSSTLIIILFLMLSLSLDTNTKRVTFELTGNTYRIALVLISSFIISGLSYITYTTFYAELLFSKSISSLNNSEPIKAYEYINKAVSFNPRVDRYHQLSAGINMALAESLAKKEDITDEDKKNISQLIQQAIREGKASVAVGVYKSTNWEGLSSIYQTITAFAQGSDKFAIESINQAILLDPINPILRIKLGGIYYSLEKYDLAVDSLKLAVIAKPNYPNSHYNLALAYKGANNLERAKEEINATLSLLGKGTLDYEKALSELQTIEGLSEPSESTDPAIDPKIELPDEYSPEDVQE